MVKTYTHITNRLERAILADSLLVVRRRKQAIEQWRQNGNTNNFILAGMLNGVLHQIVIHKGKAGIEEIIYPLMSEGKVIQKSFKP